MFITTGSPQILHACQLKKIILRKNIKRNRVTH